jgi:hypothetical protein
VVATTTCRMRSLAGELAGHCVQLRHSGSCMRKCESSAEIASGSLLRCPRRSCLHHALYWGHLAVAARLISTGCSLHLPDHQVSGPLLHAERGVVHVS